MNNLLKYILVFALSISVSSRAMAETCQTPNLEFPCNTTNQTAYFEDWVQKFRKELPTLETREEALSEMKRAHCTGKINYFKIAKTVAVELLKTTMGTAAGFLAGRAADRLNPAAPGAAPGGGGAAMLMASSLGSAITGSVQNIFAAIADSSLTLEEGLKVVHRELQAESEALIKTFSDEHQREIEKLDVAIAQMIFEKKGENALKCLARRQLFLSIPSRVQNVAQYDKNGDSELAKAIDENVERILARYPQRLQEPLSILVQSMRDNSIADQGQQVQAFLYGPTGTGKTTFVRRLSEALGLPLCIIDLSKLEPQDLLGVDFHDALCNSKTEEVLGKIANCFVEAGVLNPIIFFDEAGEYIGDAGASQGFDLNHMKKQMIQATFKKSVLDPNMLALKLKGLGIDMPTVRANYLFASNYQITDAAILSRMPQYHFSSLTITEKTAAAEVAFNVKRKSLAHIMKEDEIAAIETLARAYLPFILEEDEKRNPGARTLQEVIKELIGHIRSLKMKEAKTGKSLISEEGLRTFILESFSRREKIRETGADGPSPMQNAQAGG